MYCQNCGTNISDNSQFCPKCGKEVNSSPSSKENNSASASNQSCEQFHPKDSKQEYFYLQQLSEKIKTEATVWVAISIFQIIIGIYYLVDGIPLAAVLVFLIAFLNFNTSKKDRDYSGKILIKPIKIVENFMPLQSRVINLIYNVLLGGIIGVAGSIMNLVIRNYVLNNRQHFQIIEQDYLSQSPAA